MNTGGFSPPFRNHTHELCRYNFIPNVNLHMSLSSLFPSFSVYEIGGRMMNMAPSSALITMSHQRVTPPAHLADS